MKKAEKRFFSTLDVEKCGSQLYKITMKKARSPAPLITHSFLLSLSRAYLSSYPYF